MNFIYTCEDMDLRESWKTVRETEYKSYQSNTERIDKSLEEFIEE